MEDVTDLLGIPSGDMDDMSHITTIGESPSPSEEFRPEVPTIKINSSEKLWIEGDRLFKYETQAIMGIIQNDDIIYQVELDQWCKSSAQTIKRMVAFRNKILDKIKSDNNITE